MKTRILTLVSISAVIVVSVAFTMPKKQTVKVSQPVAKTESDRQTAGGFALDAKD